jgi:hypothetical protein
VIAARSATQVTFASPRTSTWSMPRCVRTVSIRQLARARTCSVELLGFRRLHPLAPRHDRRVVVGLRAPLPRPLRDGDQELDTCLRGSTNASMRSVIGVRQQRFW